MKLKETPVLDELRDLIIEVLKKQQHKSGREKGVLDIKAGPRPGEIIYVLREMNIECIVTDDSEYLHFSWPTGRRQKTPRNTFLENVSAKLSQR